MTSLKFAIAAGGCALLVIVMLFVVPPGTVRNIPYLLHLTQPMAANTTTVPGSAITNPPPHTCKCVAFRLDDIQDYFLTKPQMQVIDVFSERNASLTIGVIGNYFGNDGEIVDFVRVAKNNNNSKIEVANHGWNHEDFSVLSRAEQSQLMAKTNKKIYDLLDVKPVTFIAPYEKLNNDTFAAALENGIQYISSDVANDPPPYDTYGNNNEGLHRFPETALTGDTNDDDTQWIERTPEEVLEGVHDSLDKYGFVVVTMHPQEYSVREGINFHNEVEMSHIKDLETLIDKLQNEGLQIVTISQIQHQYAVALDNNLKG